MADERADKAARPGLGATGETVRRNIRWIRDARKMSATDLSDSMRRLLRPIPVLGIQRIEAGTRRVDVDDLVAIAVSLDVSPASLLMPMYDDHVSDERDGGKKPPVPERGAEITEKSLVPISAWNKPVPAGVVWRWLSAAAPLVHGTLGTFIAHGLPGWERDRMKAEVAEVRRRAYEQAQAELTGQTRDRRLMSEIVAEVRADAAVDAWQLLDRLEAPTEETPVDGPDGED